MLNTFREWTGWIMEGVIMFYVVLEFYYDKSKDDQKKHKKTKTTKRTTQAKDGSSIVEEINEVSEPPTEKV